MLECKNITVEYHKKTILHNISLRFEKGLTCILGQNGAGKSTLIKVLSGQVDEYCGSVLLHRVDIKTMSIQKLSKDIVFMNQSYEVAFDFTVEEIIKMGFNGLKFDLEMYQKAIEMTHILHFEKRTYNTLSGGEKQRVQFARAIARLYASKAGLLFLDEPSSSADIKQELNMIQIAQSIANQGYCVVMISHNISLARKYANTVILLKSGKLQKHSNSISNDDIMECFDVGNDISGIF